jgi:hypothetical protein
VSLVVPVATLCKFLDMLRSFSIHSSAVKYCLHGGRGGAESYSFQVNKVYTCHYCLFNWALKCVCYLADLLQMYVGRVTRSNIPVLHVF